MIFHLGKKRRKLACHRHMGWVFAREGPSSSCCLLPLLCSVSPEDTPAFTYLLWGGKLQRQFKLFLWFLTPLLFQNVPCANKGQTRIRPLSHMDEVWRGLMVAVSCIPQDMGVPGVPDPLSCLLAAPCHPTPPSDALATRDAPALPGLSWAPGHCARAAAGLGSSSHG